MAKKRMLADVLWEAANEWLDPYDGSGKLQESYSCPAVCSALGTSVLPGAVRDFLESLGCDTGSDSLLHEPWAQTPESQGVRYMWLLLAMHVAEDEGLTV